MIEYQKLNDPGHGWLKVPISHLIYLDLRDKISAYSYQSRCGKYAYLEEDCDLPQFTQALKNAGKLFTIDDDPRDCSWIRGLPYYRCPKSGAEHFNNGHPFALRP